MHQETDDLPETYDEDSFAPATPIAEPEEETELQQLFSELEVRDTPSAIQAIRTLRAQISERRTMISPEAKEDSRKMLEKIRTFASKVDSLSGTVASMEDQLRHLYGDRERLEREIGASEVDDVISLFNGLYMTIVNLESQLVTLYADKEMLDSELGRSDPMEIVAMFRNVSDMVRGAHRELFVNA